MPAHLPPPTSEVQLTPPSTAVNQEADRRRGTEGIFTVTRDQSDGASLPMLLAVSGTIIVANCLIGIFAPIMAGLDDEIAVLDTLWRIVAGQLIGIDYHTYGVGPYLVGTLLWHWLGPHSLLMRFSITLFCLAIAVCGCVVAKRNLPGRSDLALLFCLTLAFQLSAPTIYPDETLLSIAGFHDRLVDGALAVLFLQAFGYAPQSRYAGVIDAALTAFLLNVLFLTKISGLVLGLGIVSTGCLSHRCARARVVSLCLAVLAFVAMTVAEFTATGLQFAPLIQDYEFAARSRLAYSFYDLARGLAFPPLAGSVALLLLFAAGHAAGERRIDALQICLLVGSYAACQFALKMATDFGPSTSLAPAAVASLAGCLGTKPIVGLTDDTGRKRWSSAFSRLGKISVRDAIPFLIFAWVLLPQVLSSLIGIFVGSLIAFGIEASYVVDGGKGIKFTLLNPRRAGVGQFESSLNDAASALVSLNLDREPIANLDFPNPFPVLLLAPPPKGVHAWVFWGFKMPRGAVLRWQDVIGDACVVTLPARPNMQEMAGPLADTVRPKLAADFKIVYRDELWTIYRQAQGCTAASEP